MTDIIKWPYGEATTLDLSATGTQALEIVNEMTIVDGVTIQATGNRTLNLTVSDDVHAGAILFVKSKTAGTQTTVFGTAMNGTTITGVAGETKTKTFIYDGTTFHESVTPEESGS